VSTLRVIAGGRFLEAEVHCLGAEADEIWVLRAFVDDWQAELVVEGALSGQIVHIQHGCQPGEQV